MKAMETSEIVAMPTAVLKELPQPKMAPNPVSPVNMSSVTNGAATTIPATNGETVVEETEKSSIENGENAISQHSVGVKRKDGGGITKESRAPNLKKMRLFTNSDDEDDPDDPQPHMNGNSSDNSQDELKKRLENIPEKSKKMESDQTEGINVQGEVTEALQPKEFKEALQPKEETKENSECKAQNELSKRLGNIPKNSKEMETAETEGINVLGEVTEALQQKEVTEELQPKETKENSEYEKEEAKLKSKLRRLSRRELESMILKRLTEKILNQHDLGKLKQLSEKLKATLENNRKKTVQFHKEVEDLKKVTQKLMLEHNARKGQYVPPVRIQRSVQIQATENNIKKGVMYTSTGAGPYKTIAPRPGVSKNLPQSSKPSTPTTGKLHKQMVRTSTSASPVQSLGTGKATNASGTTQKPTVQPGQMVSIPRSAVTAALSSSTSTANSVSSSLVSVGSSRMIRAPTTAHQASVVRTGQQQVLIPQPNSTSVALSSSSITITPAAKTNNYSGGGVIDLTDEDAGKRARAVSASSTGTSLLQTSGGTAQLVLLQQSPAASGVPRASAVLVSNVGSPVTTGLTTTLVGATHLNSAASNVRTSPATGATTQLAAQHPAPLPRTPPQQQVAHMRNLFPQLTLKLPHKENSIVLSWTMSKTEDLDSIASYLLYSYQEGTAPPSSKLWKRVGSVKALELPMACTLTQFKPGHVYHFAVRAIDNKNCLGPFSEPRSIRLDR